jgi:drug/metabolite transporter, DME family
LFALSVRPARVSSILLVVAGVLWGTGGLAGAMLQGSAGLGPVAVAAYRLLVGGGVASLVVVGQFRYLLGRGAVVRLIVSSGLLAQFQAAYQVAVALVGVSFATLVTIGFVPVCVAGVTSVVERRVPERRTLLAVGGALLGLVLLCGSSTSADGWRLVGGVGMSLFAGAGFSALTLVVARPLPGQHVVTSVGLLLGGVFLLPFGLVGGMGFSPNLVSLGLIGFLGVVPTALAYGAYFLGLRWGRATAAALAAMLEPLTATLLSVAFYGETLGVAGVVGALFVAGSCYLGAR